MTQLFANNAASELANAVTSGATSLTLKAGGGALFPAPTVDDFFLVTLYQKVGQDETNHEIVKCTARTGDVLTVVRAQEGTVAVAWPSATAAQLRVTAGTLGSFTDADEATQTALNAKAPLTGTGASGNWGINAATATKLATPRAINGVNFDGSANISVSVGWASVTGKPAVIAAGADAAAARTAIGAGTSNLADAPSDGKTYGRKNAAWVEAAGGAVRMVQEVLTSGTSWTAPANLVGGSVKYDFVGAGAAGSRNGSNSTRGKPGAPGAYCSGIATVVAGNSYSYTIGAPGTPTQTSTVNAVGAAGGGTTMFGATANGGPETPAGNMAAGAVWGGATATGATLNIPGAGLVAVNATAVAQTGNTPFGISPTSITTGGIGYGIGGLGSSTTLAGTGGTSGVIVLEYLVSI